MNNQQARALIEEIDFNELGRALGARNNSPHGDLFPCNAVPLPDLLNGGGDQRPVRALLSAISEVAFGPGRIANMSPVEMCADADTLLTYVETDSGIDADTLINLCEKYGDVILQIRKFMVCGVDLRTVRLARAALHSGVDLGTTFPGSLDDVVEGSLLTPAEGKNGGVEGAEPPTIGGKTNLFDSPQAKEMRAACVYAFKQASKSYQDATAGLVEADTTLRSLRGRKGRMYQEATAKLKSAKEEMAEARPVVALLQDMLDVFEKHGANMGAAEMHSGGFVSTKSNAERVGERIAGLVPIPAAQPPKFSGPVQQTNAAKLLAQASQCYLDASDHFDLWDDQVNKFPRSTEAAVERAKSRGRKIRLANLLRGLAKLVDGLQ